MHHTLITSIHSQCPKDLYVSLVRKPPNSQGVTGKECAAKLTHMIDQKHQGKSKPGLEQAQGSKGSGLAGAGKSQSVNSDPSIAGEAVPPKKPTAEEQMALYEDD